MTAPLFNRVAIIGLGLIGGRRKFGHGHSGRCPIASGQGREAQKRTVSKRSR